MSKARDLANAGTALTTVSATELGYLDGVTSAVQTQINAKQATVSGVNDTEIGYLDGVTSAIQTQINSKIGQSTAINPSTITAKGDLIVGTGAGTFVAQSVGTNGQLLSANSAQADGVEWVNPPASGGMTVIATGSFSSSTTSINSIPTGYKDLVLVARNISFDTSSTFSLRLNSNSSNIYGVATISNNNTAVHNRGSQTEARIEGGNTLDINNTSNNYYITFHDYLGNRMKTFDASGMYTTGGPFTRCTYSVGMLPATAAISSIQFLTSAGSFNGGTYILYGVN